MVTLVLPLFWLCLYSLGSICVYKEVAFANRSISFLPLLLHLPLWEPPSLRLSPKSLSIQVPWPAGWLLVYFNFTDISASGFAICWSYSLSKSFVGRLLTRPLLRRGRYYCHLHSYHYSNTVDLHPLYSRHCPSCLQDTFGYIKTRLVISRHFK